MSETFADVARRAVEAPSERPLYARIAASLEPRLAAEGAAGLPSARTMAVALGVNRATVTAAYRELARRGLLVVRRGRPSRAGMAARPLLPGEPEPPAGALDLARYAPDGELLPPGDLFRWLSLGEGEGEGVAQYGSAWGYPPLRAWLAARLAGHGLAAREPSLLLTSGVQHALDLILRVLCRPGDAVVVEDPTYPGLPPLLATHGLRPVGVDAAGELDPEAVAAAAEASGAKLAILTPTLHNPTGHVVEEGARRRLLELLQRTGCTVVEEFFEPALVADGPAPPALGALDPRVIVVGSFSKSLFPGLRVGWVIGPGDVLERVAATKRATDLSGSPLLEAVAFDLCRRGALERQLARLGAAARERTAVVRAALEASPAPLAWSAPRGGFSLLLRLPAGWSSRALAARAAGRGVWVLPGPPMSVSGRDDVLRVAFAAVGGEALRRGVQTVLDGLSAGDAGLPLV